MLTSFIKWCKDIDSDASVSGDTIVLSGLKVRLIDLDDPDVLRKSSKAVKREEGVIRLFSSEWDNRQDQWKNLLRSKLGIYERKIGARECVVTEVLKSTAKDFLEAFHIQGANRLALVYFGIFLKEELVGVMSLGRHSRQIAQNRVVLDRLCFKSGTQVVGGASKLFCNCIQWAKDRKYDEIISFSDRRWTQGDIYRTLGFELEKTHKPDYFYVKAGKIHSKQSQKKSTSRCPSTMTEAEWAAYRGFTKVYGFGKIRWSYNLWPGKRKTLKERLSERCAKQHSKGVFKHSHIRGYFFSEKNGESIYYGSSYELRCLFLLEREASVKKYKRCEAFKGQDKWRNPDLWVDFSDGRSEIWEVKPKGMLSDSAVKDQIADSAKYASEQNVGFRIWTEDNSGLGAEHEIIKWAKEYLDGLEGDTKREEREREARKKIRRRYYERHILSDKVDVYCDFCDETHVALRLTYKKNIERNGRYICERHGGHLAGKKPKLHLRKSNPYEKEGKKECTECKTIKSIDSFNIRKASYDGLDNKCRDCRSRQYKEKKKKNLKAKPKSL